jgi:hypothetical protein
MLYFQPSEDELLKILGEQSRFEQQLVSSLIHTLRQGVYLADPQTRIEINTKTPAGELCARYITKALQSDIDGDKLFALRKTGPSMRFILQNLPMAPRLTAKGIFQLCLWRTFAFGHLDRLSQSSLPISTAAPDFVALEKLVNAWSSSAQKVGVPAYGNFQFIKKEVSGMLEKLWDFSKSLAEMKAPPKFAEVYEMICERDISCVRRGGIVTWLLLCDLAEYSVMFAPTGKDLAEHMLGKGGPSGPGKGLLLVGERAGVAVPASSVVLAGVFERVLGVLQTSDESLKEIKLLVRDCERLQGRILTIMDIEHGLCKLAREDKIRAGK